MDGVKQISSNKVTIVIPLYNPNIDFLIETLKFIVAEEIKNIDRILLIDDGSPEALSKHEKTIKTIWNRIAIIRQLNKGAGGARNYGVKYAQTDIVVFLDQDCRPVKEWIKNLIKPIVEKDAVSVMGSVLSFSVKNRIALFLDYIKLLRYPSKEKNGAMRNIITANAAFQKKVLLEVDGFDERLKIAGEDFDLTYKLIQKGYGHRLSYAEHAAVQHFHRETLRELYKQFYGYGYGTMLHCILRNVNPEKIGFKNPTFIVIVGSLFSFLNKSIKIAFDTRWKYGILNKIFFFPFFEYIRQYARLRGHIKAKKEFGKIKKEMETVDVRKTVKIILKDEQEKFLVIHRPDGVYGLIGGGIKKDENKEQALSRECFEELNITTKKIKNLEYIGKQYGQGRINYHYKIDVFCGILTKDVINKIKLSEEHDSIHWFLLDDVPFPLNINLKETLTQKNNC